MDLGSDGSDQGLVVADIGAGTCWASSILAKIPAVSVVHAVEPSETRLIYARSIIRHFGVEGKVNIIQGTFLEPNIPEKVDLVSLCASFHHCPDKDMDAFFTNLKSMLKPNGRIFITNEHYVNWLWITRRFVSYFKHLGKVNFSLGHLQAPDEVGNHWRTEREITGIFKRHGFKTKLHTHKDKRRLYDRIGWRYYCAVLSKE